MQAVLRTLVPVVMSLLTACGTTQTSTRDDLGDETDTCPPISGACYDGFDFADDDGCPDPPPMRIVFEAGSTAVGEAGLRALGDITTRRPAVASVVRFEVVGYGAPEEGDGVARSRAEAVGAELEALGFGQDRLDVSVGGPEDVEGSDPAPTYVRVTARRCLDE